ncbi:molecular chaperone DnaJ, partial [Candidatus Woesearchaeota archaeon]|nr:molecular chaperone DnaJ [Candidatus Woesearchaeota archaeon]
DLGDVFDQFFGGGFGGRGRHGSKRRGADLIFDMDITLEEAAVGGTKKFTLKKLDSCENCDGSGAQGDSGMQTCTECEGSGVMQTTRRTPFGVFATQSPCKTCRGSGEVLVKPCKSCSGEGRIVRNKTIEIRIPAGIDNNMKLRVSSEGEAGERGTTSGDLYVVVHVKPHKLFSRAGDDLRLRAPVSFVIAALGGTIKVPTIYGEEEVVEVPAGTSSGTVFTVAGTGMHRLNNYGKGAMHIEVFVDVPQSLTKKQKSLLKEFEGEITPTKKSWWSFG